MGDFQGPVKQGKVTPGSRLVQSRCSSRLGTARVLGRAVAGGSLSCTLQATEWHPWRLPTGARSTTSAPGHQCQVTTTNISDGAQGPW